MENVTSNGCSQTKTDAKMRIVSAKRRVEIYVGGEHILPAEHLFRSPPVTENTSCISKGFEMKRLKLITRPHGVSSAPPAESSLDYCLSLVVFQTSA